MKNIHLKEQSEFLDLIFLSTSVIACSFTFNVVCLRFKAILACYEYTINVSTFYIIPQPTRGIGDYPIN